MARYTTEFDVETSPETVFAYLEDFTNGPDWDPGIADAERLDEGEIGVGSRFGLDLLVVGQTQRWVYEVEEHEPTSRITFATRTSRATGMDRIRIDARPDGGSHVRWEASFEFTGTVGSLVDPVFGLLFHRIASRAVSGLRPALAALAFNEG